MHVSKCAVNANSCRGKEASYHQGPTDHIVQRQLHVLSTLAGQCSGSKFPFHVLQLFRSGQSG